MSELRHESFITKKGRVIGYTYGKRPGESKPCVVVLDAVVVAPTGPRVLTNTVPVHRRLNKSRLEREAERLERRAVAVQRGEAIAAMDELAKKMPQGFSFSWTGLSLEELAAGEDDRELPKTDWPDFLRANPVVLEAYPHTLNDLVSDDDEQH